MCRMCIFYVKSLREREYRKVYIIIAQNAQGVGGGCGYASPNLRCDSENISQKTGGNCDMTNGQKKGRNGETELCSILNQKGFSVRTGRALNFGTEPDLIGLPQVHIECKRHERVRLYEWMAQATEDSKKFSDGAPCVFFRKNRQEWLVCMKLTDWVELYKASRYPPYSD